MSTSLTKKRKISISKQRSSQKMELKKIVSPPRPQKNSINVAAQQDEYKSSIKKIYSLNDRTFETFIIQGQYFQAVQTLKDLHSQIQSTNYGSHKKTNYVHLSVYHSNMAFVMQQKGQSQECVKNMQLAIQNYEFAQGYVLSRQENLAHSNQLIKLNLQYFTCLSNVNKHLEAIVSAQKCIHKLSQSFRILQALCSQNQAYSDTPDTIATETESRVRTQKVNFKRIVIKQAQKMLKFIDVSSPHKIMTQNKQKFEQKLKNMYFWKDNNENNAKSIQKQFYQVGEKQQTSSCRNLLGVQKTSNFTEQFSLGELMALSIRRMRQKLNLDQYYLLSSPKIVQMVLFASVCYFTIATQTRFKQIDSDINSLKITQKYKKLNKDEIIFRCKVLHLKAIQLAASYLPSTNSYFNHILNSFNKNYKSIMDQINQESQSSMKSYNKSLEKYRQQQNGLNQEYGMNKVRHQNTLHASAKLKKVVSSNNLEKSTIMDHSVTYIIKKRIQSKDKPTTKRKKSTMKKNIH